MTASKVLDELDKRLRLLEDELAIIRLVASYGPLVDCGSTTAAPALFADDGVYDVDVGELDGAKSIERMLEGDLHRKCLSGGIAHAMGLPWVRIDGDRAVATNTTQIFLREGETFRPWRIAQNVWRLSRREGEWKVSHRTNRLIGADGEAMRILSEVQEDPWGWDGTSE